LSGWNLRYGRWWMLQWSLNWWLSLGVHVDLKQRKDHRGRSFGPYLDLHLGCVILSLGWNPAYSGELERLVSTSRGGLDGNCDEAV